MLRVLALMVLLATLAVAGCGGDDEPRPDDGVKGSRTLTVYASVPLQGEMRQESRDAVDALKLALTDAGGTVGAFTVSLAVLDDATQQAGGWDRDRTLDNATTAAKDRNAIALVGEWDSDASALSIPILNEAELLQVSPASTYVGLTRVGGVAKGEPEKFYPSGRRSFARLVPADDLQARVMLRVLQQRGVRSVALGNDRSLYGKGLVAQVRKVAEPAGIQVLSDDSLDPTADEYTSLAQNVARERPDAFIFGGSVRNGAARVFRDVAARNPGLPLFGGDALAVEAFVGALTPRAAAQVTLTSPAVGTRDLPPAGRRFVTRFRERFGRTPAPMAVFGYASMQAVMQAIRGAGDEGNARDAVTAAMLRLRVRDSVLGPFAVDRRGDTSRRRYGVWRIRDGRLGFVRAVEAPR